MSLILLDSKKKFIDATGGTITTSGNYRIHTFNSNADFEVLSFTNVNNQKYRKLV